MDSRAVEAAAPGDMAPDEYDFARGFGDSQAGDDAIEAGDAWVPPFEGTGSPCSDNSDCPGGYCIEVLGHGICTATCIEECPDGWTCQGLTLYGQDVLFVCVPAWYDQCKPCSTHEECGGGADFCLDGEGGAYCATHCSSDADCPAEHTCLQVEVGAGEGEVFQCQPLSGSCKCLGGSAGAEVCNGLDDDCDGEVDEGEVAGCITFYLDEDLDGYGVQSDFDCACFPHDAYTSLMPGDCDDSKPSVHPAADEECNEMDDDCDGAVDEGISSSCGNCDPNCHQLEVGPGGDEGFSADTPASTGVKVDADGHLSMGASDGQTDLAFTYIWIANSAEDTVSKLDTQSGAELARYRVCSNPSRTSVDMYGDVWVACRGKKGQAPGGVAHIAASEIRCKDKDNNGALETSGDADGDGKISGAELLDKGKDECVLLITDPSGAGHQQKSLAVDKYNHPWVGDWDDLRLRRLDPVSGQVVQTVDLTPTKPYGLVVDGDGVIWISGHSSCNVGRLDPETLDLKHHKMPGCTGILYGIAVDLQGDIWVPNMENARVYHLRPDTLEVTEVKTDPKLGYVRGVAASADGRIYVGHHTPTCVQGRSVSVIDAASDQVVGVLGAAQYGVSGPTGVALDYQGFVWAINQCTDSATKIDPTTGQTLGIFPVGDGPYTYSDMTGYSLHTFASPKAVYTHVLGSVGPSDKTVWSWLDMDLNAMGQSAVLVRLRVADTVTQLESSPWSEPFGPFPPASFPLDLKSAGPFVGKYLGIEVSLTPDEEANPVLVSSISVQYIVEYP